MREILIGKPSDDVFSSELLRQLYRFRYRIFKERLDWQVSSRCALESDIYDELDPVYTAFRYHGSIIGTFRLLPTTGPYMLHDVFSELLRGEPPPCAGDVWELSRFAVNSAHRNARAQLSCSEEMFAMLRACYDLSRSKDIRELVMVTSVALERMLRSVRIPLVRLGDGKATRLGKALCVACRVEITAELGETLHSSPNKGMLEGVA